jgi:hypothetical protein
VDPQHHIDVANSKAGSHVLVHFMLRLHCCYSLGSAQVFNVTTWPGSIFS